MVTRQTEAHNDAPLKNPPPDSNYEFFWTAFGFNDLDFVLPGAWAPLDQETISALVDPEMRGMMSRVNRRLIENDWDARRRAVQSLREAGVPPERLESGADPKVMELVDRLVQGERCRVFEKYGGPVQAIDLLLREYGEQYLDNPRYRRTLAVRVVTAARFTIGPHSTTDICAFLNQGLPRDEDGDVRSSVAHIDRHALRSVDRSFRRELKSFGHARIQQLSDDVALLNAFDSLRLQAMTSKSYPHLRGLRGRRLAEAMHEIQDLREAVFTTRQKSIGSGV
ncbi:hypothetical protein [Devosia alba]|uniref:hypothetical protein n=1 Tax=Devosia alba TaxID=3152360 RepID=UPI00326569D0